MLEFTEYQYVRLDGRVIKNIITLTGEPWEWSPLFPPAFEIACRHRVLPDGEWIMDAYFPDGFYGPAQPWPEGKPFPQMEER